MYPQFPSSRGSSLHPGVSSFSLQFSSPWALPRAGIRGCLKLDLFRRLNEKSRGFGGGEGDRLLAWQEGNRGAQGSPSPETGGQRSGKPAGRRKAWAPEREWDGGTESQEHGSRGSEARVPEGKTSSPLGFPTSPQPAGEQSFKPRQDIHSSDPETLPSHTPL